QGLGELVRPARALGAPEREEPVDVRVLEAERESACVARIAGAVGRRRLAEEALGEPEPEALLADPRGPVEEERAGKVAARDRTGQGGAGAAGGAERQERTDWPARIPSQVSGSTGSGIPPLRVGARTWNSMWGPSGVRSPPPVPRRCRARTDCPSRTSMLPR